MHTGLHSSVDMNTQPDGPSFSVRDHRRRGGRSMTGNPRPRTAGGPLVSVITTVLNGAETIERTIESILTQDYPNIEYIVIDGGSTDGTLDIVKAHDQQIDLWISEPDAGIFDGMNKGIGLAAGELINLLNSDDWFEPNAVSAAVAAHQSSDKPSIIYGPYTMVSQGGLLKLVRPHLELWRRNTICHQSLFVHRDIYDQIGLYDTSYKFAADYDFLLRAAQEDVQFASTDVPLVNFRENVGAPHQWQQWLEANRIHRKYFRSQFRKRLGFSLRLWKTFLLDQTKGRAYSLLGNRITNSLRKTLGRGNPRR